MRQNVLRAMLDNKEPIINAWLSIPSGYIAEGAGHQGFHSVTVDLQHGMIGFETAVSMLQAISATPAIPLVRAPSRDPEAIMHLLDAGAYGVVCPMVSTNAAGKGNLSNKMKYSLGEDASKVSSLFRIQASPATIIGIPTLDSSTPVFVP